MKPINIKSPIMKKLLFLLLLAIGFVPTKSNAQFNLSVNIGSQPSWGPSGYERAEYYYMPDIDSYYYVPKRQFIYISNGRWTFSTSLPERYRDYDLYNGYKVVINSPQAYYNYREDRIRYAKYRSCHSQTVIRYGRSDRYYDNDDDDDSDRRYVRYKEHGHGHHKHREYERGEGNWRRHDD